MNKNKTLELATDNQKLNNIINAWSYIFYQFNTCI